MTTIAERAESLADPDTRNWAKAAAVAAELESAVDWARDLADAIEALAQAMEDKDAAMELPPSERADDLATAWDTAAEVLQTIADQLNNLESAL